MFGKGVTLFRLLGFEVRVDLSWLVLAALITWSLAVGVFPYYNQGLAPATYWWMGVIGAAGMFFSILFHEFCHSLVARRFGLTMRGITLFIFGGVAEMEDEPPSPKAEFFMAVAGPLSSVVLGLAFYAAARLTEGAAAVVPVQAVLEYLAMINWVLAAFNLIPAFPLDGGRVLRAALWQRKKNLRGATRIASRIGSGFGLFLIFVGVANFLLGNIIGGIWQFMIGMFLRSAAESSYRQVVYRKALEGETVERFMNPLPVTVPPSISIRELVEAYIYRHYFKMFPVLDEDKLLGCITTRQVKEIPREEWDRWTVGDRLDRCGDNNTIGPGAGAMQALSLMGKTGNSRLMVVKDGLLVGIVSLKDIMGYLSTKMELGDEKE
ncbi:MAG TPA: site-2 protease family protein [Nitrospirota bacterium]|nr:site-2 protease family protein [Nitrospirota bacterium]